MASNYNKTDYALNHMDENAIVCMSAVGSATRLTVADFASKEEFKYWKAISDNDYYGIDQADRVSTDDEILFSELPREIDRAPSAEDELLADEPLKDIAATNLKLRAAIKYLSPLQRERLFLYVLSGNNEQETASLLGCSQQQISKSVGAAKKKVKKIIENWP